MKLVYRNNKIKMWAEDYDSALKNFGRRVADGIFQGIKILKDSKNIEEVPPVKPFLRKKLKGDLKNYYSIRAGNTPVGIIFFPTGNKDEIQIEIFIEDIKDYH